MPVVPQIRLVQGIVNTPPVPVCVLVQFDPAGGRGAAHVERCVSVGRNAHRFPLDGMSFSENSSDIDPVGPGGLSRQGIVGDDDVVPLVFGENKVGDEGTPRRAVAKADLEFSHRAVSKRGTRSGRAEQPDGGVGVCRFVVRTQDPITIGVHEI